MQCDSMKWNVVFIDLSNTHTGRRSFYSSIFILFSAIARTQCVCKPMRSGVRACLCLYVCVNASLRSAFEFVYCMRLFHFMLSQSVVHTHTSHSRKCFVVSFVRFASVCACDARVRSMKGTTTLGPNVNMFVYTMYVANNALFYGVYYIFHFIIIIINNIISVANQQQLKASAIGIHVLYISTMATESTNNTKLDAYFESHIQCPSWTI